MVSAGVVVSGVTVHSLQRTAHGLCLFLFLFPPPSQSVTHFLIDRTSSLLPPSKVGLGKLKLTASSLRNALYCKRRPHFVFGSRERREGASPLCFPPLPDSHFSEHAPSQGVLGQPRDLKRIEQLTRELRPLLPARSLGYEGKKNGLGQLHGKGSFRFSSGNRYEGSYKHNKRDGFGKFYFANGEWLVADSL